MERRDGAKQAFRIKKVNSISESNSAISGPAESSSAINGSAKSSSVIGRILSGRNGSALIIAVVIMIVLMFLALALLLVSYTLFATANRQQNLSQSRELAQAISRQLAAEITISTPDEGQESDLWKYLKDNISISANRDAIPSKWPYYEPGKYRHEQDDAYRYFKLGSSVLTGVNENIAADGNKLLSDTTVLMYWENDRMDDNNTGLTDAEVADGTVLTVVVTCNDNNEETTVTTQYELNVDTSNSDAWTWRKEYESS